MPTRPAPVEPTFLERLEPRILLSAGDGLAGAYFASSDFSGAAVVERTDRQIGFDWGSGSPAPGVGADNFSIRWTGSVRPVFSETYTFHTEADGGAGGVKLWIDDDLIIDTTSSGNASASATVALDASNRYKLRLDYADTTGDANLQLLWSSLNQALEIIPYNHLFTDYSTADVYGGAESVDNTYYVSKSGSDSNNGLSLGNAFLTLNKAWLTAKARNEAGESVKVYVDDGVYRETVQMWGNQYETANSIIWEAINKDKAIVSGSDIFDSNWSEYDSGEDIWTHAWTEDWGYSTVPSEVAEHYTFSTDTEKLVLRRELFFIDGRRLDPVASLGDLEDNTFYIDETNDLVYIDFTDGEDPTNTTIEGAMRPQLFYTETRENITIRGFRFQHAANSIFTVSGAPNPGYQRAALDFNLVDHITVEDVNVVNNSATGISVTGRNWNSYEDVTDPNSDDIVFDNVVSNFNGKSGTNLSIILGLDMDNVETSYNNWRGVIGGFTGWSVAGQKHLHIHNGAYNDIRAIGNHTRGFWWDVDVHNSTLDSAYFADNLTNGMFVEAIQGPATIQNSIMVGNGDNGLIVASTGAGSGGGATGLTLINNVLRNNGNAQLKITGSARTEVNFLTQDEYYTESKNLTLYSNDITVDAEGTYTIEAPNESAFLNSLDADDNLYYHSGTSSGFKVIVGKTLAEWRTLTGQEEHSRYVEPTYPHEAAGNYGRDAIVYAEDDDTSADEDGEDAASIIVRRVGVTDGTVSVKVDDIGSAVRGVDFAASETITIADGNVTASLTATPIDDGLPELDETILFSLAAGGGYEVISGEEEAGAALADNDRREIHINFQVYGSALYSGYEPDYGYVYGDRGNGYYYGWETDGSGGAKDRNDGGSPDQRYDTLVTMSHINPEPGDWEIEVPNGWYSVHVVVGEPLNAPNQVFVVEAEGVEVVSHAWDTNDRWGEGTETVYVADGRLTLSNGTGVNWNKINFVDIETVLTETVSVVAVDDTATESGSATGVFRIARSGTENSSALTVDFALSGTATEGLDFEAVGASVEIPVGVAYVDVLVEAIKDNWIEGSETVTLTLASSANYTIDPAAGADMVTISDDGEVEEFSVSINFQPDWAAIPTGFEADFGEEYGDRGNGYTYGWENEADGNDLKDRNYGGSPDQAHDTLITTSNIATDPGAWEIEVPNGVYRVTVVVGEPLNAPGQKFSYDVEGQQAVYHEWDTNDRWATGTIDVYVTDGKLTLTDGADVNWNKLCYIVITNVEEE